MVCGAAGSVPELEQREARLPRVSQTSLTCEAGAGCMMVQYLGCGQHASA